MFEKLKQNLQDLQQEVETNQALKAQDKEVLAQLSSDLQTHVQGQDAPHYSELLERTNLAYEEFREDHPDLAVVLQSLMQILQNMGV